MTSTELYAKAHDLETLANDVEGCVDPAKTVASSPDWDCDNATDVRDALKHWRSAAQNAARNLRDEAARVRGEARKAENREDEAREEREREREREAR
ncbi:hypothetical protein [Cellulomonas sp. PhB150]|uniref:hypothetical protein n=1 Tax=Cellulomonas sp. PhB150 TaxID=2485188 RepID=UPI000F4933D9|nr:hypothetical protein [Cellulomonas sp. PhB150]ROS22932.1 hypothetical protein EDF34_3104 [Cellulomonas sp. PhB150]